MMNVLPVNETRDRRQYAIVFATFLERDSTDTGKVLLFVKIESRGPEAFE
jgi:hypothetical protein